MAGKKAKTSVSGGREIPRKHYCSAHDEQCQPVMLMPGRKMRFRCSQGCEITKQAAVLK